MRHYKERPRTVVLPVRLSQDEYANLAALAALDQRTRCGMMRRLIAQAARRSVPPVPTNMRGDPDAA